MGDFIGGIWYLLQYLFDSYKLFYMAPFYSSRGILEIERLYTMLVQDSDCIVYVYI